MRELAIEPFRLGGCAGFGRIAIGSHLKARSCEL